MATLMRNKEQQQGARPTVAGGDRQMGKRPRSTSETSTQITIDLNE